MDTTPNASYAPFDWLNVDSLQASVQKLGDLVRDVESDLDWKELPGLDKLIDDWYDEKVDVCQEDFDRRILRVFQKSVHNDVYKEVLNDLPITEKILVEQFVNGKISVEKASEALIEEGAAPQNSLPATTGAESVMLFANVAAKKPSQPAKRENPENNLVFENWGRTVKNTPATTYFPNTISEVQSIVKDAVKNNRGVRVSGYRHSWAPIFGRNNKSGQSGNDDVLISTLSKRLATVLPNFTSLPGKWFEPPPTELNEIKVVDAAYVNGPTLSGGKKYVRVGTATTNEQFRRWCIKDGGVTLPMNIIEVEITMGGSNAPICHGAGIRNPTLSDLVRRIEYVDVHGEWQVVDMRNPDLLKAASGCFGLLGVVTHITLECDAMCAAVMRPVKLDVIDAVPPPEDLDEAMIPRALYKPRSPKQKQIAVENFERRANNDFYAEWFWFPYSSQVWVNTWDIDASTKNVVSYPSKAKIFFQVLGTTLMNMAQKIVKEINALEKQPYIQTTFLSWLAMKNLDEVKEGGKPIRTLLPDALHFQRGVQNIRVRDMEVELPLHAKKGTTTERDYTNVRRAWWDAIITCYANIKRCPMRMPLEMRIMGSSEVTMAPQRGHKLGTCAIEILTLQIAADIWEPYAQQVLDRWTSYKDNEGNRLDVRPHWAKEWKPYKVDGKLWSEKLKHETYRDQIVEFKQLLSRIGAMHGWTLADLKKTFSNDFLDWFYFDDVHQNNNTSVVVNVENVVTTESRMVVTDLSKKVAPVMTIQEVTEIDV